MLRRAVPAGAVLLVCGPLSCAHRADVSGTAGPRPQRGALGAYPGARSPLIAAPDSSARPASEPGLVAAAPEASSPALRFWDWSEFPVRPEAELRQKLAAIHRVLRNAIAHPPALHREYGRCSFELQSYVRYQGAAELRSAQKGTIAGFIEVWRSHSHDHVPRDALLALTITLADLDQQSAEDMYLQLARLYPGSRELAWAHLRMAEQAQLHGQGELAARRYVESLELLPQASRAHRHANAMLVRLAPTAAGTRAPETLSP